MAGFSSSRVNLNLTLGTHQSDNEHEPFLFQWNFQYLEAMKELLVEFCSVEQVNDACNDFRNKTREILAGTFESTSSNLLLSSSSIGDIDYCMLNRHLLSLLNEVNRRYNCYFQEKTQMDYAFDAEIGIGSAMPYTMLAHKGISWQYKVLKDAIITQLKVNMKILREKDVTKEARGLPKQSIDILRAWLFEHFLHPYPSAADKDLLARQTGLTKNQVSNWFINARVRLWKPLIEKLYEGEANK
ncbi:hypothetical protein Syun_019460 [Stephania yunnanensis]|uniref:Homeobox domain-containing protein n=1 Tax=Stephania yunnanensis TaxID=152371 RepID=A0AAP0IU71_9MAGN